MEQQIVKFNGVTYDYCEDIKFYSVIGLLDPETDVLRGVEVVSDTRIDSKMIKEALQSGSHIRLVCGSVREELSYYAIDIQAGEIIKTRLKPSVESYAGSEATLSAKTFMDSPESKFKIASKVGKVEDLELTSLLERTLKLNHSNSVWNGIQEAGISQNHEKVKVLGA